MLNETPFTTGTMHNMNNGCYALTLIIAAQFAAFVRFSQRNMICFRFIGYWRRLAGRGRT
jgi:hypothetical protein